jgi:hypothetical protein
MTGVSSSSFPRKLKSKGRVGRHFVSEQEQRDEAIFAYQN